MMLSLTQIMISACRETIALTTTMTIIMRDRNRNPISKKRQGVGVEGYKKHCWKVVLMKGGIYLMTEIQLKTIL